MAQVRAALNLLEKFIAEYETRTVNIFPPKMSSSTPRSDDDVISGAGIGELKSLNQAIHDAAEELTSA